MWCARSLSVGRTWYGVQENQHNVNKKCHLYISINFSCCFDKNVISHLKRQLNCNTAFKLCIYRRHLNVVYVPNSYTMAGCRFSIYVIYYLTPRLKEGSSHSCHKINPGFPLFAQMACLLTFKFLFPFSWDNVHQTFI